MIARRKECIAMLLAGGQGSRLNQLTANTAKPAVPFGGKYKIIDFPLSNCVNSGIDTVGILTQYEPLELNKYIGNGQPWGLNKNFGGVHILPPYTGNGKLDWYKGTANAIYQNINFIEQYNPDYVLVLSGDHIYKMDYSKMLNFHKDRNAECTISVIDVDIKEASRFGIMSTNDDNAIYEFEEKPENPKSTKASMGIYIFNWNILKEYLIEDEKDSNSKNDFGKNIITKLLKDNKRLFAYNFDGYWKDVGTIESLWQSNMDLLDNKIPFSLKDSKFKIYARDLASPPGFISSSSKIQNSLIAEGCNIKGCIDNSIISTGSKVGKNSYVSKCVVMPGAVIEDNVNIEYAIIGEYTVIKTGTVIEKNDNINVISCV